MAESKKDRMIFLSTITACALLSVGVVLQIMHMLRSVGVTTISSAVSLIGADKVNFALYITFAGATIFIMMWAAVQIHSNRLHLGGIISAGGFISSILVILIPMIQGYQYSSVGLIPTVMAVFLIGGVSYNGSKTPSTEKIGLRLSPKEIAIISLMSALTAVITGSSGIMLPSLTGGYTHVGDTIIYVAALLFGCKVGGIVGIIGPVVADIFVGYPRWFVTVLAHGSQGYIAGLARKRNLFSQILILAFSGVIMASSYFIVNVFIKGYPLAIISFVRDLFGQALVSIILGLILSKTIEKYLPTQFA